MGLLHKTQSLLQIFGLEASTCDFSLVKIVLFIWFFVIGYNKKYRRGCCKEHWLVLYKNLFHRFGNCQPLNRKENQVDKSLSQDFPCINYQRRTPLVVQWLRLQVPVQGVQVQSLVRELRSHRAWGQKNPKHKTEAIL